MLSAFSVKKPYTVLVAVVLVIVLGFVSFTGMTTDLLPSLNLPYVIVITSYPGASPEEVEMTVTRPLEALLGTSAGLNGISSVSSENASTLIMEYTQSTNMDSAMIALSGSIDLLADELPDGVGRPMLMRISPDMLPIMIASVDMDNMSLAELSAFVDSDILPQMERIPGMAAVSADGLFEEYLHVSLNAAAIRDLNQQLQDDITSELNKTRDELEKAKSELTEGRETLEAELPDQQQQLAEASLQLNEAIAGIQAILAEESVLEAQKAAFEYEKNAIDAALEQIVAALPDSFSDISYDSFIAGDIDFEALGAQLEQGAQQLIMLLSRQAALETELQNTQVRLMTLNAMKEELEKGLAEAQSAYLELEKGKMTLSIEMSQAKTQIEQGEAELEKGLAELDKASEEALAQASLDQLLNANMLSQIIAAQNFSMPAGYIRDGENEVLVKVGDTFSGREALENALLFSMEPIGDIRLSDVATITTRDNSGEDFARINGQPGIILSYQKQSEASTAEVTNLVHQEIESLTEQHAGLQIVPLMDQGEYIDLITGNVLRNLIFGGLLAIAVLMLFLKDIRPTLVIAFSIPVSLMFALTLMYFSNVTLNLISLSGLALAVGMLVDNSIVVIENIYRLRSEGVPPARAAVTGAREISGAIFASTLTTICVFLPIAFTDGLSRQLFADMGLTIAYSLLASLLIALTLVPTLSATMLKKRQEKKHPLFDRISQIYANILGFTLKFKPVVLVLAAALLGLSLYGVTIMGLAFVPEMDSPQMSASLSLPPEENPGDSIALVDEINSRIMAIDAVEYVGALSAGFDLMGGSGNDITFYILLKDDRTLSNRDVERLIYEKTEELEVELVVSASNMDMSMLGGSGVQLIIEGQDLDQLAELAGELAAMLKTIEGIGHIEWQGQEAETELRVIVNKDQAMAEGLTVAQVFQSLSSLLQDDRQATILTEGLDEWAVMIENSQKLQIDRSSLADYVIESTDTQGQAIEVRLGTIAAIEEAYSPTSINRDNQSRFLTVSAEVMDGYNASLISRDVEDKLADISLPEGFQVSISGETETIMEAMEDLILVLALAILFIYLIMVAQFQNLLAPFIILFTIPLAFTGGLLLLWMLNYELSVIAMLGFLVLAGIVVNNGIVFISTVNQLRLDGMEKKEALRRTGQLRLRPILMTALTTILAMSTLALGVGEGAEMTQPMAVVTIGGLSYATLLTLFVVPVLYDLFHRKEMKKIDIGEENESSVSV